MRRITPKVETRKPKKRKAPKSRKPGLIVKLVTMEIEPATTRHKKPCFVCGCVIPAGHYRVIFAEGSGRNQKKTIVCLKHASGIASTFRDTLFDVAEYIESTADYARRADAGESLGGNEALQGLPRFRVKTAVEKEIEGL